MHKDHMVYFFFNTRIKLFDCMNVRRCRNMEGSFAFGALDVMENNVVVSNQRKKRAAAVAAEEKIKKVHRWENLDKKSDILKEAAARIEQEFEKENMKGLVSREDFDNEDIEAEEATCEKGEEGGAKTIDNNHDDDSVGVYKDDSECDSCSEIFSEQEDSEEDEYDSSFVTSCSEESEDDEWVPVADPPTTKESEETK